MSVEEAIPFFLFGALSFAVGLAFRLGRRRGAARWYFDEESPWYIRNFVFAVLPSSAFWILVGAALIMFDRVPEWMAWSTVAAGSVCALVAFVVMYRPPEMMKPRWLRDEEARRGEAVRGPEHRGGVWMVIDRFGLVMMLILAGGTLLVSVLMVAVEVTR
jgi:hypothetical protein